MGWGGGGVVFGGGFVGLPGQGGGGGRAGVDWESGGGSGGGGFNCSALLRKVTKVSF